MSKKIMVVDDTAFMRAKLKMLLGSLGHEVITEAEDGLDAVEKWKVYRPEVTFMDITMPRMDGLCALREILAIEPKAAVIIVSALQQEDTVMEALRIGAKNYVVKPFKDEKVKEALACL